MEGRTSELKAHDKMTDELSPDGFHIFTSQSCNTALIPHLFYPSSPGSFKKLHLPVSQRDPPSWRRANGSFVFRRSLVEFSSRSDWGGL